MVTRFKFQLTHFLNLHPNSAAMMVTEPCWAMPLSWIGIYGPIYMRELGLTETQIGWTVFAAVCGQLAGISLGGWLADHWGRKRTIMTADFVCWFFPLGIWFLASLLTPALPFFLGGAFLYGFGFIGAPAWNCIFTEGATREQTQNAYALYWLLLSANGIFAPLGGLMVKKLGLIPGYRLMIMISILSVAIGWSWRLWKLQEPMASAKSGNREASFPIQRVLKDHLTAFQWMWNLPFCRILLAAGLLYVSSTAIWGSFAPLYWTDPRGLKLSKSMVSLLPAFGSAATCLTIFLVLPRLKKTPPIPVLLAAALLMMVGMVLMIGASAGMLGLILVYSVLYSAGAGLFCPVRDSQWLLALTRADYRAKILAIINLAGIGVSLPSGPLGGFLYHLNPHYPFWFCIGLSGMNILMLITYLWRGKSTASAL
jgi:MFS family permease